MGTDDGGAPPDVEGARAAMAGLRRRTTRWTWIISVESGVLFGLYIAWFGGTRDESAWVKLLVAAAQGGFFGGSLALLHIWLLKLSLPHLWRPPTFVEATVDAISGRYISCTTDEGDSLGWAVRQAPELEAGQRVLLTQPAIRYERIFTVVPGEGSAPVVLEPRRPAGPALSSPQS